MFWTYLNSSKALTPRVNNSQEAEWADHVNLADISFWPERVEDVHMPISGNDITFQIARFPPYLLVVYPMPGGIRLVSTDGQAYANSSEV